MKNDWETGDSQNSQERTCSVNGCWTPLGFSIWSKQLRQHQKVAYRAESLWFVLLLFGHDDVMQCMQASARRSTCMDTSYPYRLQHMGFSENVESSGHFSWCHQWIEVGFPWLGALGAGLQSQEHVLEEVAQQDAGGPPDPVATGSLMVAGPERWSHGVLWRISATGPRCSFTVKPLNHRAVDSVDSLHSEPRAVHFFESPLGSWGWGPRSHSQHWKLRRVSENKTEDDYLGLSWRIPIYVYNII